MPRHDLGNALPLGSLINSAGRVLGMSLAGILAAAVGDALCSSSTPPASSPSSSSNRF